MGRHAENQRYLKAERDFKRRPWRERNVLQRITATCKRLDEPDANIAVPPIEAALIRTPVFELVHELLQSRDYAPPLRPAA